MLDGSAAGPITLAGLVTGSMNHARGHLSSLLGEIAKLTVKALDTLIPKRDETGLQAIPFLIKSTLRIFPDNVLLSWHQPENL